MLHAIHSVAIISLVPHRLDLQVHNYTKWWTLFTMVLHQVVDPIHYGPRSL
jgi:hypothetical protein